MASGSTGSLALHEDFLPLPRVLDTYVRKGFPLGVVCEVELETRMCRSSIFGQVSLIALFPSYSSQPMYRA